MVIFTLSKAPNRFLIRLRTRTVNYRIATKKQNTTKKYKENNKILAVIQTKDLIFHQEISSVMTLSEINKDFVILEANFIKLTSKNRTIRRRKDSSNANMNRWKNNLTGCLKNYLRISEKLKMRDGKEKVKGNKNKLFNEIKKGKTSKK